MEKYVKVKPGADEFRVEEGSFYIFYLKQPAENGRANKELLRNLERILGVKAGVISGHQSRRKKIKADISEEEFETKIQGELDG
jgi:uncharacterized protein YggU (UPF0235/DUF167 family)